MTKPLAGLLIVLLLCFPAHATDRITRKHILQLIEATDAAAQQRDTATIGKYLGEDFEKVIEFPHEKWMATVRLDKQEYLDLIEAGWPALEEYDYRRDDMVIHIVEGGQTGKSYSTITETLMLDGTRMVSKFREHALYALENGRPVIIRVSGHTLVGDTMQEPGH